MMSSQVAYRRDRDRPCRHKRRRGFLLLTVLVLLVITGLILVGFARRGSRLAVQARDEAADLQRRWGMWSCQQAILPQAEAILAALTLLQEQAIRRRGAARRGGPVTGLEPLRITQDLGQFRFEMLLADENAKLNLNTIYHHDGPASAARLLPRLTAASGQLPLRPLPLVTSVGRNRARETDPRDLPPAFQSWGQVFDLTGLNPMGDARDRLPELTRRVTLWGNGRLNLRRAADTAAEPVLDLALSGSQTRQLLEKYRLGRETPIAYLLQQLQLPEEGGSRLEKLLTAQSECFSLWVTARSPQRQWRELTVWQTQAYEAERWQTFRFE